MAKIQLFRGYNSQFYFHLRADNNEIVLSSESYLSKQSCLSGIASVRLNAPYDGQYNRINAPFNYRFNLKAGNGEVIGRSEGYTTATGREHGIMLVKTLAPTALFEDLS